MKLFQLLFNAKVYFFMVGPDGRGRCREGGTGGYLKEEVEGLLLVVGEMTRQSLHVDPILSPFDHRQR